MLRRFAVVLSILAGLFMMLDGAKALLTGTYIAPGGQIGPWAAVLKAAGISPFWPAVKTGFVVLGAAYLVSAAAYAFYKPHSRAILAAVAILTLWYVPVGTAIGVVVLISIAVNA